MKIRLVVILAAAVSMGLVSPTNALAQQTDCKSIQDPKARLECFDAAPPKAPTAAPAKSAPKADRNTTAVGGWQLQRSKNAMTDKTDCILVPVGKPHVQITVGDLYISYRGRGGVQGFRYRLDDEPVSQMQLPTEIDKQIGAVHISGDTFNRILQASRLRVEVLTLISGVQNEDLAVAGVRGAQGDLRTWPGRDGPSARSGDLACVYPPGRAEKQGGARPGPVFRATRSGSG